MASKLVGSYFQKLIVLFCRSQPNVMFLSGILWASDMTLHIYCTSVYWLFLESGQLKYHRLWLNRALYSLGVKARPCLSVGVWYWLSIWRSLLYSFLTGRAWCTDDSVKPYRRWMGHVAYVQILIRQSLSSTGLVHRWLDWDFALDSLSILRLRWTGQP